MHPGHSRVVDGTKDSQRWIARGRRVHDDADYPGNMLLGKGTEHMPVPGPLDLELTTSPDTLTSSNALPPVPTPSVVSVARSLHGFCALRTLNHAAGRADCGWGSRRAVTQKE